MGESGPVVKRGCGHAVMPASDEPFQLGQLVAGEPETAAQLDEDGRGGAEAQQLGHRIGNSGHHATACGLVPCAACTPLADQYCDNAPVRRLTEQATVRP